MGKYSIEIMQYNTVIIHSKANSSKHISLKNAISHYYGSSDHYLTIGFDDCYSKLTDVGQSFHISYIILLCILTCTAATTDVDF